MSGREITDDHEIGANSTLVIVLSDGSHRVTRWNYCVSEDLGRQRVEEQRRSRLHQVVRATLFIGTGTMLGLV